ncbi:hypothetical protein R1sor_025705 [Riccia sorocarpa]|uniref:Uncharacterized protein n=1 Tax=Riccia sorocarpa TaxID=122646 RepID=A0ABD3GC36_9MARC
MQETEQSYKELYSALDETKDARRIRREALTLVDRKLDEEQNRQLDELPSEELIEEVMQSLPKDKSPGYDGVIVEELKAGWGYMRGDCFKMVWQGRRKGPENSRCYIRRELHALHQIYADDTGINITMCEEQFGRLRQVVQDFEEMSRAKRNST